MTPAVRHLGSGKVRELYDVAAFPGVLVRKTAPWLALLAMVGAATVVSNQMLDTPDFSGVLDTLFLSGFSAYVKLISLAVGMVLLLVNWPTNKDGSGNGTLALSKEGPEYFGLMLLSITGSAPSRISMIRSSSGEAPTQFSTGRTRAMDGRELDASR